MQRRCIIDPRKVAMDVAKFSACFCRQSIDYPVCKLLVGSYDGGYFSVEKKTVFAYDRVVIQHYKALTSVLPFVK